MFCGLFGLLLLFIQLVQLYGLPFSLHEGAIQTMTAHQLEMLNAIADSRKELIENWVRNRRRNVRTIAENPVIQQLEPARGVHGIAPPLLDWLEGVRSDYQLASVRLVSANDGTVMASLPIGDTPQSRQERRIIIGGEAITDEQLLMTYDEASQSSRLHILQPVKPNGNPDRKPRILLDVEVELEQFLSSELLPHLASLLGKTGEVVLVDSQKRLLTRTKRPLADGTAPIPLKTQDTSKPVELAVSGSEGTLAASDYSATPVLAAYRHVQLTPDIAWGMVVKRDQHEIFATLNHQKHIYIAISLLGIAITIACALVIATRLTRPLNTMVAAARRITQGDLTARTDEACGGEVAELAQTFNSMLNQLQMWHNELDHRVRQRTEQLVAANQDLQNEISERTKTEELLHVKTVQLEEEIAERQKVQEALEALNNSLEERIRATVTELRQKDDLLMHQNRLAAMGELLTSIAHQWRQPLNNIAAYIQTMQYLHQSGELTDDEMERDIAAVMDILKYMSQTIDDFRNFFRKDRDQHEFVLRQVVDRSLNLISSGLTASNIRVTIEGDETLRGVGYPNEYAQTLMNILYNARDILIERAVVEPRITIRIAREGKHSVVTVRDNGGGIAPEILPHIFDPYFTTKGPATGTGIGLYMARTLIERNMGGRLTARNTADGAEFRIEL